MLQRYTLKVKVNFFQKDYNILGDTFSNNHRDSVFILESPFCFCYKTRSPLQVMIYILITLILCLIYNYFLFKHLGKLRFYITLALCALGVTTTAIGWFVLNGFPMVLAVGIGLTMALSMAGCILNHAEEWKQLRHARQMSTLPARKLKSVTESFSLCRRDMLSNFRELAAKDDLTTFTPEDNFLAWKDAQELDIRIHLLPGDDWVGLLYVTNNELRDSEIQSACNQAGVPYPPTALGMAPSGLAVCHEGEVTITPADHKKYIHALGQRVLAPRAAFSVWINEYYEED